jgi:type 2 lantibiotic biosynthesis protein LanM
MNTFSEDEKRRIAGRARTLQERLDVPCDAGEPIDDVEEAVEQWREYVADGDDEAFRKRLEYEDVDFPEARHRMSVDGWPEDEPLPEWVEQLDDLLGYVRENPSADVGFEVDDGIPFFDVLTPFLNYGREQAPNPPSDYVAEPATHGLTKWLADRLIKLSSHTLFIEFKTHIARDDPDAAFGDDLDIPTGSTEYYDEFTADLLADGFRSFFLEYSFLARLVVSSIDQWTDRVEEFYDTVTDDWDELRETFVDDSAAETIADIEVLGDAHQGFRQVLGITFASGARVAFKPRNSGIVVGYYELLAWLNEHSDLPDLRTLDFVYRDDYAWMEWVQPEPCASADEVVRYYRRAGMIVCIFYALDAADMHLENIIAEGDQPVVVDLETLVQPKVVLKKRSMTDLLEVVIDTVLRSGTVPKHVPDEEMTDMAGFSTQQGDVLLEAEQFTDVNTDLMELEQAHHPPVEGENLPRYDGEVVGPRENLDAIVRGFTETYRFLLDNREQVLADDGPIESLTDRESRVRVLYRNTRAYSNVINALTSQDFHRTGLKFGLKTETLPKLAAPEDVDREVWAIYESERDILRRFNTPRFNARISEANLYDGTDLIVEDFFEQTPMDQVRERIRSFGEADLEEQRDYLRWGYGDHQRAHGGTEVAEGATDDKATDRDTEATASTPGTTASTPGTTASTPGETDRRHDFERVTEDTARAVFDRIDANSVMQDGNPTWVLREVVPQGGLHVHAINDGLYDGRVGIGVFAAALARTFSDDRYREVAETAVAPVTAKLGGSGRSADRPIGGGIGHGSIVYGLTKVGRLLEDDRYVRAADRAAASITPERIEDDSQYDVLHGSAGAILGLLALYDATGDRDVLDRARRAGEHLLANRVERDGVQTWRPANPGRPLCGFSHGTAGIAYALSRLGDATGESRFGRAALESLEHENRHYDEDVQNWPDLRANTVNDWMDAWCHGRTGVGLARLGTYEVEQTTELRRDVDRALDGLDPSATTANDHLCCGTFGRVEFLLEADRVLGDETYREQAERLAAASVRRADSAGQFSTQWQTDHWYNPTLFGGEAGVGYSLLRLTNRTLPNVLLWD